MSFRANDPSTTQASMLDATALMSDREKRFLERSWAKIFAEEIFPQIDEQVFAPLYSTLDSRPNTPVNVTVGALLLKELNGMSDDEILNAMMLKEAGDPTLHAGILQNPSDPEATYREKAGKAHRGYVANFIEEKGENGSIITDYQFEQNTYSDSRFIQDYVDEIGPQEDPIMIVADGAYSGDAVEEKAEANNITVVNTNLTGREVKDIAADFKFNDDGTRVVVCPNGKAPKSCCYTKAGMCVVSFHKKDCENCPYRDKCNPKEYARTTRVTISARMQQRAHKQRQRKTDEFRKMSAFRNGVETIPSFLRRYFGVDDMPVRGKSRMGFFLGCKVGGLNVMKFCNFRLRRYPSAQMASIV